MTSHRAWMSGFVFLLFMADAAWAQVPAIPGAAGGGLGAAAPAASAAGVPAAGATPATLWSFLGLSKQNLAACKLKICRSQIGRSLGGFAAGPLGAVTGGLFADCCPPPTAGEIAALEAAGGPQGAQAVAAKIQADEADAKARVAAVDYLGTVDCRYWKEAQIALLNALRADRNECVRFAAARAFNNGCCCSKEVIETLRIVVAGEDSDGFPAESSLRIKGTCFAALQNCLMKGPPTMTPEKPLEPEHGPELAPTPPEPGLTPEGAATSSNDPADPDHFVASHLEPIPSGSQAAPLATTGAGKASSKLSVFEARVRFKSFASTVADAQKTLEEVSRSAQAKGGISVLPPGKQSVMQAFLKAREDLAANEAARAEATIQDVPPEMIPPRPELPALQPTPPQAVSTPNETFAAPEPPVAPVTPPVETRTSGLAPKPAKLAVKTTLTTPKLPSLSLPAAESPTRDLAQTAKPARPAEPVAAKRSRNVKPETFASTREPKRDGSLMEVSSRVKTGPSVGRATKTTRGTPSIPSNTFPDSYRPATATSPVADPLSTNAPTPSVFGSKARGGMKPTISGSANDSPVSGSLTPAPDHSLPLPPTSASMKTTSGSKAMADHLSPRSLPDNATSTKDSNRSEGASVLQAFMKARRASAAGKPSTATLSSGEAAIPRPTNKPYASPDPTAKTDTSTIPSSYWGKPKPTSLPDATLDDNTTSAPATKRFFSRLFTDRSE